MGLILLVLGWVWGIWLADALPHLSVLVWAVLTLSGLIGWLLTLKRRGWRLLFAVVTFFGLGAMRVQAVPRLGDLAGWNDRGGLTIYGQVVAPADVREERTLIIMQAQHITAGGVQQEVNGRVVIHAPRETVVQFGDWVSATGLLVTPPSVDAFEYRDYLGRGGIGSVLTRVSEIRVVIPASPTTMSAIHGTRERLGQSIVNALPQPHAGLMIGVLLGDDRWIAPETMLAFNQTGAGHVLVVSGYNMTLVAGAVMVVLGHIRRIGATPKLFATWALIIAYALLVGGEPSTVRAAWMAGLVAFGYATGNPLYLPLSAAFSVLMQTAYEPQLLWDRGFQLSLAATCGIAFLVSPLKERWRAFFQPNYPVSTAGAILRAGVDLCLTTTCILAFTMPLSTSFSGQLSGVTLPVNLLIVPVQAILLMIGAAGLILSVIAPVLGLAILWLCLPLVSWTQTIVNGAASIATNTLSVYIPPWLVLLYWGIIGGVVLLNDANWIGWHRLMKRRMYRLMLGASGILGLVSVVLFGIAAARPTGELHVWFLDANGANAVLIRSPNGATIMIDGGRSPVRLSSLIGERLPANTEHLDMLILSAPDEQETSAWVEVGRRYPPSVTLTHGQPNLGVPWQTLLTTLTEHGTTLHSVQKGNSIQTNDGMMIEVLWPLTQPRLGASITSEGLALRLVYGEFSLIMLGNLDREAQSQLVKSDFIFDADVLVIPQHAQARALDGTFLATVNPSTVIIPAAPERPPDSDVLAMLNGRLVYLTSQHGTLHLTSDGQTFSILPERE